MAAAALDRRNVRHVELGIELQVIHGEQKKYLYAAVADIRRVVELDSEATRVLRELTGSLDAA